MGKKDRAGRVSVGSREYWQDASNYRDNWQPRAMEAAAFIHPGSRVLDLGCGPHMTLEKCLPAGCTYIPADLEPWELRVRQIDLEAEIFPRDLKCDCVVLLGVLEYLHYPERIFQFARRTAPFFVISYCHPVDGADPNQRKALNWINSYSESGLEALLLSTGWHIINSKVYSVSSRSRQIIYSLSLEK